MYDGIFYDLTFTRNRLNARHNGKKKTNLLFFDGHAATADTESLPGGLNAPANTFTGAKPSAALLKDLSIQWRTDE